VQHDIVHNIPPFFLYERATTHPRRLAFSSLHLFKHPSLANPPLIEPIETVGTRAGSTRLGSEKRGRVRARQERARARGVANQDTQLFSELIHLTCGRFAFCPCRFTFSARRGIVTPRPLREMIMPHHLQGAGGGAGQRQFETRRRTIILAHTGHCVDLSAGFGPWRRAVGRS